MGALLVYNVKVDILMWVEFVCRLLQMIQLITALFMTKLKVNKKLLQFVHLVKADFGSPDQANAKQYRY